MANEKRLNMTLAFNADTSKVKKQLEDLQKQLTQLMSSGTSNKQFTFSKDIEEATHAVAKLKVQLEEATNVNTGKLDLGLLNQSFKQSGTTLKQYRIQLQKLGPEGEAAFRSLASSILKADVPLKQTNTLLKDFATTLKNTAKWQISSSILHGFMGSIQSAYYYAEDLNESLNNIRIVTGQSVDDMARFAEEANNAAKALSTTTTAYTNASLIYYQQGLSDEEVKQRTDITIKMANVARESAEDVSQQMTAIWNNFSDGSKSLEHYADVMTALGAATASSTDEIAEGLEKFAAVADTVGLSYEYATAALATVTSQTRQSADIVGNAFKTIFARMEGLQLGKTLEDGVDLNKYSAALAAIGVNIKDVNGELKSMDQILDETGEKWKTLSKDQQVATAQTVAGK
jgi:TP901 family phage tail tape measure protein